MNRNTRHIVFGLCLALAGSGVVAGCGQKGPLYMPHKASKAQKTQPGEPEKEKKQDSGGAG
ncbi:MAG: lipoprotein [Gammaproteobacteria bacterium]|jgi:predicted small lipoprotein YifL|nr:lipoprotein [Gammaproteobacteria bacterium]